MPRMIGLAALGLACLAAGSACLAAASAFAQGYPNRPIRLIVGLAPGGLADQTARLIGPGLAKELGQPVVIENRAGANGNIAARQVADAPPDGYTLMLVLDGTLVVGAALNATTPFDPVRDFTPIVKVIETPLTVVANSSVPAKNLAELLQWSRSPGAPQLFYGSAGVGSSGHLAGEYLKQLTGLQMTHVAYKGAADAVRDTVSGQIPLMISGAGTSLAFVQSGQLKGLALTGRRRLPPLSEVPTAAESGLAPLRDFDVQAWAAIVGPPRLPAEIVRKVQDAAIKTLADPDLVEKFAAVTSVVAAAPAPDLGKQIAAEMEQWRQVVRQGNLRND
jgi:tripartite-type tricarboxylate transporter receptor subunit TctC